MSVNTVRNHNQAILRKLGVDRVSRRPPRRSAPAWSPHPPRAGSYLGAGGPPRRGGGRRGGQDDVDGRPVTGSDSRATCPPRRAPRVRRVASPTPEPSGLVVKPGSNARARTSGAIPTPSSCTLTLIQAPDGLEGSEVRCDLDRDAARTGDRSRAFKRRLRTACSSWARWMLTRPAGSVRSTGSSRGERSSYEAHHQVERLADVERLGGMGRLSVERQEPVHDLDAPLGREPDAVHVGCHGTGGAELVRGDRGVVQDDAEQVPEVVRDSPRHSTQALESLRLKQARYEDGTFVFGPQPLGVALACAQRRLRGPAPGLVLAALRDVHERHDNARRVGQAFVEDRAGGDR